jgi:hypothetical protein
MTKVLYLSKELRHVGKECELMSVLTKFHILKGLIKKRVGNLDQNILTMDFLTQINQDRVSNKYTTEEYSYAFSFV